MFGLIFARESASVEVKGSLLGNEGDQSQARLTVRPKNCPEHLFLALEFFPLVLRDGTGATYKPERREGGSLYFHGLPPEREFTFVLATAE